MILVVIGHSMYLNITSTYGSINYTLPSNISDEYFSGLFTFFKMLPTWIYQFHMPLFFALSGAVLALKPIKNFDKLCKGKFKRLIIPYFIYGCLFMIPIKYISGFYVNSSILPALKGFLIGIEGSHLWFLPSLFWCTISFAIIYLLFSKVTESKYVLLIVTGIIQILYNYLPFDVFFLKMGLSYIFWFASGFVFELERKSLHYNFKKNMIYFIITIILEILNFKYKFFNSFFEIFCGCVFVYLLAEICSFLFKKIANNSFWKLIIQNLFFVYLLHDPLEYLVLKIFMSHNWLTTSYGCYFYLFSRTILVFMVCLVLGVLIEKLKKIIANLLGDNSFQQLVQ